MITLSVALLGVATSVFSEVVSWINKFLTGTELQGKAAWIVTIVIAFGAAIVEYTLQNSIGWQTLLGQFAAIYAMAEIFFNIVIVSLKLNSLTTSN